MPYLLVLCFIIFSLVSNTAIATENRLALVIGNGAYQYAGSLANPTNDANDMATQLRSIGFTVDLVTNGSYRDMGEAVDLFGSKLRQSKGIGLFYYAGHGMQVNGHNYLIPVDASISGESEIKYKSIDAGLVLAKMEQAGSRLNMVFLDACRNNPFSRSFRSSVAGLAAMDAPKGSLIVYATSAGSVAADGTGRNGVFTKHLLQQMKKPGLEVGMMMRSVTTGVLQDTQDKQNPWQNLNLTSEPFYFIPGLPVTPSVTPTPTPSAPSTGGLSFDDLSQEQATRQQWATWQGNMKQDFAKAAAFADASLQVKAWEKFLAGYAQNNPLSEEDEQLRQSAQSRHDAAQQQVIKLAQVKTTILPYTPPVVSGAHVAGEERTFDGITFVWIPPGEFEMGSPASEKERLSNEQQHHVRIAEGFWLGKYEVTQSQWQSVMGSNPSHFKGSNNPVEQVSWNDIQDYLKKLGNGYRLPTEAEWEYAARAGTQTPFHTGKCISSDQANYNGNYPYEGCPKGEYREKTMAVGSFSPNGWGLYDMHGNVYEWTSSLYKDPYDGSELRGSPVSDKGSRSLRGGSWNGVARYLRAANRYYYAPSGRSYVIGFRVVRVGSLGQDN